MQSKKGAKALKRNDGVPKEVTHFFKPGPGVRLVERGVRFVGRGFNRAENDALASLPFAPLHLREFSGVVPHESPVTSH